MALIVVLQEHPPAPGTVVALLMATALAVGLAELYSEIVGAETRTRHRITREHLREIAHVVAVGFGIAFPSVFFVLAALGAMEVETAFSIAKWSGVGLIAFYGFCAARLAGARRRGARAGPGGRRDRRRPHRLRHDRAPIRRFALSLSAARGAGSRPASR